MKTILITGVSSGLGRAVATEALARGHRVVGTLRQEEQRRAFEALAPGRAVGRLLDVADTAAARPLVDAIEHEVGGIDVLINNAGYYLPRLIPAADLVVMRRMDELHLELSFVGSWMLRDLLNKEGIAIGRCHVATLMKRLAHRGTLPQPEHLEA